MEKKENNQFQNSKTKTKLRRTSDNKKEPNTNLQKKLKQCMVSTPYTLFISFLTVYSIFSIDIDKGFFNQNASFFFSTIHTISMGIFLLEIILNSIIEKDYVFYFYFWIDVFSTCTMILQIIWIENLMSEIDNIEVAISFTKVSRASRLSKIGAKSTKILKLIRLIKLFKFVKKEQKQQQKSIKQYSQVNEIKNNGEEVENQANQNQLIQFQIQNKLCKIKRPNVDPQKQQQIQMGWELQSQQILKANNLNSIQQKPIGTKVGEKLNYQIQKNLVLMVMGLIILMPLLSADTWFTKTSNMEILTQNYMSILKQHQNQSIVVSWMQIFFNLSTSSNEPMLYFTVNDTNLQQLFQLVKQNNTKILIEDLRKSQKLKITNSVSDMYFQAVYSKKQEIKVTSWINIGRSVFIIFVLVFASFFFIKDLQNFALTPLYKMNNTVEKIDKNPFSALDLNFLQTQMEDLIQQVKQQEQLQLQTNILQKFFIKITSLLALGIGEVPFKLNSQLNQEKQQISFISEDLNFQKIQGIFVCMQVAYFNQIIENAEDIDSSSYVNLIIQIFHEIVIQNGGFIFHQDECYSIVCWKTSSTDPHYKSQQKKKAELVFMTYVKFLQKISLQPRLKKYQYFQQLIENFELCKIHLGIHPGIAYCGAIGSDFRVTLRVLGEDICIVKSLCKIAKKYKIQNLFTGNFLKLAPFLNLISRKIDQVEFSENKYKTQAMTIHSLYVNSQFRGTTKTETMIQIHGEEVQQESQMKQRRKIKNILRMRQQLASNINKYKTQDLNNYCKHFLKRYQNVQEWIEIWKESNDFYQDGQWTAAKEGYQSLNESTPLCQDYANNLRIKQINQRDEPPSNWKKIKQFPLLF